jgi:hypothetical protein
MLNQMVGQATRSRRTKVVDLIFGYGRWQCLGKSLAIMEMYKVFVEVSRPVPLFSPLPPLKSDSVEDAKIPNSYSGFLISRSLTLISHGTENQP